MKPQRACIIGGTGFVGRHLLTRLGAAGYHCLVPTRRAHRHRDLKLYPHVELREIGDDAGLAELFAGCSLVVNLAGILNEAGGATFESVHVELVRRITAAVDAAAVPRFLHMSALHAHAEQGASAYLRSKGAGEDVAHGAAAAVTSFRPSVIFGRATASSTASPGCWTWRRGSCRWPARGPASRRSGWDDVADAMLCTNTRQVFVRRQILAQGVRQTWST
jgi:uncharacterized protein YbjT (DUF2867 family)